MILRMIICELWLLRRLRIMVCSRIQYSAFIGSLRRDELNSLLVDLKNLTKDLVENVQLYPVCDTCFKGRREVGKPKRWS
jgi:CRISPR-associated endonuclease Cas2